MIQPIYGDSNLRNNFYQRNTSVITASKPKNPSFGISYKKAEEMVNKSTLSEKAKKFLIDILDNSIEEKKTEMTSKFAYFLSLKRPKYIKQDEVNDWFRAENTLKYIEHAAQASLKQNIKGEKIQFEATDEHTSKLLKEAIRSTKDYEDIIENIL